MNNENFKNQKTKPVSQTQLMLSKLEALWIQTIVADETIDPYTREDLCSVLDYVHYVSSFGNCKRPLIVKSVEIGAQSGVATVVSLFCALKDSGEEAVILMEASYTALEVRIRTAEDSRRYQYTIATTPFHLKSFTESLMLALKLAGAQILLKREEIGRENTETSGPMRQRGVRGKRWLGKSIII